MSDTPIVLVTGATGNVGSQVARNLLDRNEARVRVAVRSPDSPAATDLAERGAELVQFDYEDEASMREAFTGVERAFLVVPLVEHLDRLVSAAIGAAEAAGVAHVVRLSAHGADPEGPFALARWHGNADAALARGKMGFTILQPTFFQDNVLNIHGTTIRSDGAFYGASGGGRVAYISSADIARAVAAVLVDPSPHAGKTYLLTGGEALSDAEVASHVSEVAGRPVSYVDVGSDGLAASMRQSGAPDWLVDALVALEGVKAAGWAAAISPAISEITGREPEPYRAFLERSAPRLRS